jgi:hypothetical protein
MARADVALYIEPQTHHFLNDRLFAPETAKYGGDQILAVYIALRDYFDSRGVPVHTADLLPRSQAACNIYVSLGMRSGYRKLLDRDDVILSAFFAIECPVVEPALYRALPKLQKVYRRLYSWSDSDTLYPLAGAPLRLERFFWPQSFDQVHEDLWRRENRKFLVMMNSNKVPALRWNELYTERLRAVEHFTQFEEIDLYGKGWDSVPFRLSYGPLPGTVQHGLRFAERQWRRLAPDPLMSPMRRAWKGVSESKSETLSHYQFAVCFENAALSGWITEKVFDCFFAGVIPIYWGAPDITDHVPAAAFIDMRAFSSYADLRRFLKELSAADIAAYREAARAFISSEGFNRFRKQALIDIFRRIVEEDSSVTLAH